MIVALGLLCAVLSVRCLQLWSERDTWREVARIRELEARIARSAARIERGVAQSWKRVAGFWEARNRERAAGDVASGVRDN